VNNTALSARALRILNVCPIVNAEPRTGAPWLPQNNNPVEIKKILLPSKNLAEDLHAAFSRHECDNPQFGLDWLDNLVRTALSDHESAALYVARRGPGDLVALPLKLDGRTGQAHALANFYTSTYTPVIQSDSSRPLLVALLRFLADRERFTALTLSPIDSQTPFFAEVAELLEDAGWTGVHHYACFANWTHSLQDATFQTYLSNRPSRLSNTINRKTRSFFKHDRGRMEVLHGGEQVEYGIKAFVSIYERSWKTNEPFDAFMPELIRLSARRDWLRLGLAYYDDIPVASQVWLVSGGVAYIYKLAHLDEYAHLSPGTVLSAFMLERTIDQDHIATVDFLTGDDDYKKDWMSHRGERKGVAAYNPRTLRGRALQLGHTLKRRFK
jgi:hypothetical protein